MPGAIFIPIGGGGGAGTLTSFQGRTTAAAVLTKADVTGTGLAASDVSALGATAAAGGDLSGNYPNPTVAKLNGVAAASYALLASPALTGTPTVPTATALDNSTKAASTAYADAAVAVETSRATTAEALKAPLASPTFTGTPAAPTAAVDTNTTQLATSAFVLAQAASATPLIDGTAAVGTSTRYARGDHVHPTDTTRAPLASPALTGTPTVPTAAPLTNSTQAASTAYADAAVAALKKVVRTLHTFSVTGLVQVASGDTNYLPPFFVSLASGDTAKIVKVRAVIHSGTSATVKLQQNGGDITGFTGISVTTTAGSTTPTAVAVAEDDLIALVVTAVSGSPVNMSVTVVIEHTV